MIKEANRMGIKVLPPDINESASSFTVTKDGVIRFGLAAIKGVGGSAVEQIVAEREKNGLFTSIFDFAKRVNLRAINKRSFEALAMAGAFDSFPDTHRAQYFHKDDENSTVFIEKIIQFGHAFQERSNSQQHSLFGGMEDAFEMVDPELPVCKPWTMVQQLRSEKEVTGFYISGHPLDDYRYTIDRYCNVEIANLRSNLKDFSGQTVMFAGLVTSFSQKMTKRGDAFGIFILEDFTGTMDLMLFKEDFLKKKHLLEEGNSVFVIGKVEERYNQPGNYSFRVNDVILLSDAMNKMSQKITIQLKATDITSDFTKLLNTTVHENAGSCKLELKIEDPENGKFLTMHVGKTGIEPRPFVHEIAKLGYVGFSIN